MAVYTVHSQLVQYHYKTYVCTKATLILVLTSLWTVMFPVIFTYRSHGESRILHYRGLPYNYNVCIVIVIGN